MSPSSLKRTNPYPRDWPVMASVMIFADLQLANRDCKMEIMTDAMTSGPRLSQGASVVSNVS
jgi:hypothetical protein